MSTIQTSTTSHPRAQWSPHAMSFTCPHCHSILIKCCRLKPYGNIVLTCLHCKNYYDANGQYITSTLTDDMIY